MTEAVEAEKKPGKWYIRNWGDIVGTILGTIYMVFLFVLIPILCIAGIFIKVDTFREKDAINPKKNLARFYGVKWGSTQQEARAILQRNGFQFDEQETTECCLIAFSKENDEDDGDEGDNEEIDYKDDLRFSDSPPNFLTLHFGNKGFYEGHDFFTNADEKSVDLSVYDDARYSLGQIYGKPKYETHCLPAEGKTDLQFEDIKSGKVKLKAQWNFDNGKEKQTLTMNIEEKDTAVHIRYRNENRFASETRKSR